MRKSLISIFLTLITSASLSWGQLLVGQYEFLEESSQSNTGVALSGTVELFDDKTIKFILTNLSGTGSYTSGDFVGFGFADPFDDPVDTLEWGLFSSTPIGWTVESAWQELWNSNGPTASREMFTGATADNQGNNGDGLEDGQIGTWVFNYTGSAVEPWNDLIDKWDEGMPDMLARFKTVGDNGDSDKMLINFNKVPEPSTYGLFGAGALVLLIATRRFKKVA